MPPVSPPLAHTTSSATVVSPPSGTTPPATVPGPVAPGVRGVGGGSAAVAWTPGSAAQSALAVMRDDLTALVHVYRLRQADVQWIGEQIAATTV